MIVSNSFCHNGDTIGLLGTVMLHIEDKDES